MQKGNHISLQLCTDQSVSKYCTSTHRPYLEPRAADLRQIHQHDTRVDPRDPVERVAREAAVPANLGDLVLGSHCRKLGAVEGLKEAPDIVHGPQEQNVGVHIE